MRPHVTWVSRRLLRLQKRGVRRGWTLGQTLRRRVTEFVHRLGKGDERKNTQSGAEMSGLVIGRAELRFLGWARKTTGRGRAHAHV